MKVVLLDVSHWHFPLYVDALLAADIEIVALSEPDTEIRERYASLFNARAYDDTQALLAAESFDFALVFGRHVDMPTVAGQLIDRGIPFVIEKPAGLSAADVARMRRAVDAKGLFVTVPFVQRVSPLWDLIERLKRLQGAEFTSSAWRFFAGPPARYPTVGCGWMLDPSLSGGGCLINLAHHFIDLAAFAVNQPFETVMARTSNALHGSGVEDQALVSLATGQGRTGLVETGYCFPNTPAKREYSFSLVSKSHYLQSQATGVLVHAADAEAPELIEFDLDSDPYYGIFLQRTFADLAAGRAPVAGLDALEATMRVIDAGYRSVALEGSCPL